jgi:hypothetical protein
MKPPDRWGNPARKPHWVVLGIIALVVAVLAFAWREREGPAPTQPPSEADRPPAQSPEPAPAPRTGVEDTSPIVVAGQGGEGCEAEEPMFEVTVTAVGERASPEASEQPVYLQDQERVVRKYYLDLSGVREAEKQRLAKLLAVGQRLKVRYVICGSGGFRFLTFVQPTATG